ncbi:tumor necrosis factor receptor superfamily member 5 isoform X2 [Halichoeres trimaculatus]|uniref:tumor necrosis factor receptor superfamily member 5 isoform X2 n=1 Tax=Halichoeres trimaculatus TaxID=147232 RepID=UPI003D9F7703
MSRTCISKIPAWVIILLLFFLLVFIPPSSPTEVRVGGQCVDGTYSHEGRECCLCGVGLKLVEHCTTRLQYGKCEPCDLGTFSSHPSSEGKCEPCTSCTHPNENLEVEEQCTSARNTKCRCKQDHYCSSSTDICHLCHPCKKCGAEGIKIQCAGKNNTVCNEDIQDKGEAGKIVGIVIAIIALLAIVAVAVYLWKKRRTQNRDGNAGVGLLLSEGGKGKSASQHSRCGNPASYP